MNLNFNAMKTTHDEYLSNFAAVKGEKYAKFMQNTLLVLIAAKGIDEALRPEDNDKTTRLVAQLMSMTISSLAREAGIPDSDLITAMIECETMFSSIYNASTLPPGIC